MHELKVVDLAVAEDVLLVLEGKGVSGGRRGGRRGGGEATNDVFRADVEETFDGSLAHVPAIDDLDLALDLGEVYEEVPREERVLVRVSALGAASFDLSSASVAPPEVARNRGPPVAFAVLGSEVCDREPVRPDCEPFRGPLVLRRLELVRERVESLGLDRGPVENRVVDG